MESSSNSRGDKEQTTSPFPQDEISSVENQLFLKLLAKEVHGNSQAAQAIAKDIVCFLYSLFPMDGKAFLLK